MAGAEMSIYRKVEVSMWGDEKFRRLTPLPPSGQSLWFYLLTGPHTGIMPGISQIGRAALAENLGWTPDAFAKAFHEVFREGLAKGDWEARVIWLPNAIKHNPPASPNVVTAWGRYFNLIPDCSIKVEAYNATKSAIFGMKKPFIEAFGKAFCKPSYNPFANPLPIQEQVQEQTDAYQEEESYKIDLYKKAAFVGVSQ